MIRNIRLEDAKAIRDISAVSLGYKTTEAVTELQIEKLLQNTEHFIRVYEDDETHTVAGFMYCLNISTAESESNYCKRWKPKPPHGITVLSALIPENIGRKPMRFTNTAAITIPNCKNVL